MTDNIAVLDGYTVEVRVKNLRSAPLVNEGYSYLLVRPQDMSSNGLIDVWDTDWQEYTMLDASQYTLEMC